MVNQLVILNKKPLKFTAGYPPAYSGNIIHGSEPSFALGSWGHVLVQNIQKLHWRLRYQVVKLKRGRSIRTVSSGKSLTTTAVLKNNFTQTITGVGKTFLQEQQFASAFKDAWSRRMDFRKNSEIITLDATWDQQYLEKKLPNDIAVKQLIKRSALGIPVPFGEPYRHFSPVMTHLIDEILTNKPQKNNRALHTCEELMNELLKEVVEQSKDCTHYLSSIPSAELRKTRAAKELIINNRNEHMTISEIANMIDLNECTLKSRFMQMEGKGLFEYLLWLRCQEVTEDLLHTTLPLKGLYTKACYANMTSFVRGFEKHMGCSPRAFRKLYSLK